MVDLGATALYCIPRLYLYRHINASDLLQQGIVQYLGYAADKSEL